MPLLPPDLEDADVGPARALQARLRDMEANVEQFGHQVICGDDGRLYLAWGAMASQQVEAETYPHLTPSLRPPEMGDDDVTQLDARNASLIHRIQASLDGYGLQLPLDMNGSTILARANPLAIRQVHAFQVVWMGSRRQWVVTPGSVAWQEFDHITGESQFGFHETETKTMDGDRGWIVLEMGIQPQAYDSRVEAVGGTAGYRMECRGVQLVTKPENKPPKLSLENGGVDGAGTYYFIQTWSEGTCYLPIAYVEPPGVTHQAPIIRQITNGVWSFLEYRWYGTLPNPSLFALI